MICETTERPRPLAVPALTKQVGHEKMRVVEKRFARSMETPLHSEFHSGQFTVTERVKTVQAAAKQEEKWRHIRDQHVVKSILYNLSEKNRDFYKMKE